MIFIVLLYSSTLGIWRAVIHNFIWLPARFYTYPLILVHSQIPAEKHIIFQFWLSSGNSRMVIECLFLQYLSKPIQEFLFVLLFRVGQPELFSAVITATFASMIVVFKY
jgi:hypothetical protein